MSQGYNRVILVGRLTRDPELKYSTAQVPFVNFTIAVNRQPSRNQPEPEADFPRIVAFGKTAEFIANYLSKGRLILVEGRLQTQKYTAQDGTTRFTTDVIANSVQFMEAKGGSRNEPDDYTRSNEMGESDYGENLSRANGPSEDLIQGPTTANDQDNDDIPF